MGRKRLSILPVPMCFLCKSISTKNTFDVSNNDGLRQTFLLIISILIFLIKLIFQAQAEINSHR